MSPDPTEADKDVGLEWDPHQGTDDSEREKNDGPGVMFIIEILLPEEDAAVSALDGLTRSQCWNQPWHHVSAGAEQIGYVIHHKRNPGSHT